MKLLQSLIDWFLCREDPAEIPAFEPAWRDFLEQNLPLYQHLPQPVREKLHSKIAHFLATTHFEGCGGLELDEEILLTISAQACLLIVQFEGEPYPALRSVLVYPSTFQSKQQSVGPGGIVTEGVIARLGESWSDGTVVLAWDAVERGARNIRDGHNVTMHEFAHQLDQADGTAEGTPIRWMHREDLQDWCELIAQEYEELVELAERGKRSVLDHYGALNPAEFFAVATEAFFEKPRQLRRKEPELYAMLSDFYRLDPASWFVRG